MSPIQPNDINDNEIRLIRPEETPTKKPVRRSLKRWLWLAVACVVALVVCVFVMLHLQRAADYRSAFEPEPVSAETAHLLRAWLSSFDTCNTGNADGSEPSGCAICDTIVNDIPIRVYLPLNATAHLEVGRSCISNPHTILAFQAADVRADNGKIVGAFVDGGKPVAWGLSKKGYCAIIDNHITVGMADNSPLFEEATEKNGYFFRQYPLVSEGIAQPSELRTQSIRRALCDLEDHICVIETQTKTSMHDFSQLLADISVSNAIYLIGGDAYGIAVDDSGTRYEMGALMDKPYKYMNYIYWSCEK